MKQLLTGAQSGCYGANAGWLVIPEGMKKPAEAVRFSGF
jgi:hypothetical protein